MCSLHHSEEAESSVTHEAEESTGSDTRGTHNACACLFFPISCLSSALMWSCDFFFFAGEAESGRVAPTAAESSL